jgi:hypothetical protein
MSQFENSIETISNLQISSFTNQILNRAKLFQKLF